MKHLFCFLALLFLVGCVSVDQLLEQGRYAEAYAKAVEPCTRVRGSTEPVERAQKRPLKPKQLARLQAAYSAVQAKDLARVNDLETANEQSTWPGRYRLYTALYERSRDYANLVPPAEQRVSLSLRPSRLAQKREDARLAAGVYYLHQAAPNLPAARAGNKDAARDAYYDIEAALDYLPERANNLEPLLDTLAENGTLRIWLYPVSTGSFDREINRATQRLPVANRDWTEVTTTPLPKQRIDLEAELVYLSSSSSGIQYHSSSRTYKKEVLDYIEKKKKKVKVNDTTWVEKIIEIKHYKTIYAEVTTHEESINVSASGRVVVYLPRGEEPRWERRVGAREQWSDEYTTCSGDLRALPGCRCPGNRTIHRPSEWSLIDRAVAKLPGRASSVLFGRYAPPRVPKRRSFWTGVFQR
ncbi:MAG: hypothetical protein AAF597_00360 [Bacteroidota bacterium]